MYVLTAFFYRHIKSSKHEIVWAHVLQKKKKEKKNQISQDEQKQNKDVSKSRFNY